METLREMRLNAGLRQDDVAKKAHVDQTAVSAWEIGRRCPSAKSAKKLAKVYGHTVEEIKNAWSQEHEQKGEK